MAVRPIRLAIVNDYEIVVHGLARMLESHGERVEVVELVANVPVRSLADIALYDTYSQTQGVHTDVAEILATSRADRLVVYSWNLHPELVKDALEKGAVGYLGKRLGGAELVEALERIHAGEVVVTADDPGPTTDHGDWPGRQQGLTARESEIIALITVGLSNQEIADRAFLSINSVKSYIRSAYRKMGVTSRSKAVLWGIEHGFRPDHVRIPVAN